MSINIWGKLEYFAEEYDIREIMRPIYGLSFLVKALFRKNSAYVSENFFEGKTVELDDIAYYLNDGKPDFMYVIKVDELKYLMNSSFAIVSKGYHQIVQLHDKNPYTCGYIAGEKLEGNKWHEMLWGILDHHGKETIECKYVYIHPIICRKVLNHDADYIEELSSKRDELLFFECSIFGHKVDVYDCNGTLIFENINRINTTEEKIRYRYDNVEDRCMYTETKQLEKIHVGIYVPNQTDEDGIGYTTRYVYQVNLSDKYAELNYIGIEEDDRGYIESEEDFDISKIPLPKMIRVAIGTVGDEFDFNEKVFRDFLIKLTEDSRIYDYVDSKEVNVYFKLAFKPDCYFEIKCEQDDLKLNEPDVIIEKLKKAIESVTNDSIS